MKKEKHIYLSTINTILKGNYLKYAFYLILLLGSVFFSTMSTFMTKILLDILQQPTASEYFLVVKDPLSIFFTNLFGGFDFLKNNLWIFSIIIVGIALAMALFNISRMYLRSFIMTSISKKTQLMLFNHVERLPYNYIKSLKNGDIIQTCTRDEETLRRFLIGDMHTIFYTLFTLIFAFTILTTISYKVALMSICVLPILFIYSFFLIKIVRKRYRLTDDSEGLMTAKIEENLASVRIVKAFNNEKYEIDDFEKYLKDYRNKYISWRKMSSFFFSSSDIMVFSQITIATIVSIILCVRGEITYATVIVSTSYVSMIVWPIRDVATTLSNFARVLAALDRIHLIINQPIEDIETGLKPKITGNIEFRNVSFKFDDDEKNTLSNISFKVKKGQTVAIMGKTGSGKSTLVLLLTRLYDLTSGEILIDGINIKDISKKYLRQNISLVLQEPFLFSKSVISNIKITNEKLSKEEVINATKIAAIHENILALEKGYHTQVGEKGVSLSGGQKQRVAIARSLVNKTPILVFDDSLSAVDTETDIKIRSQLKARMKDTTTFIITHRVATAKDADVIIVLENNTISEIGNYQQLINQDGLFKRINDIQSKME